MNAPHALSKPAANASVWEKNGWVGQTVCNWLCVVLGRYSGIRRQGSGTGSESWAVCERGVRCESSGRVGAYDL